MRNDDPKKKLLCKKWSEESKKKSTASVVRCVVWYSVHNNTMELVSILQKRRRKKHVSRDDWMISRLWQCDSIPTWNGLWGLNVCVLALLYKLGMKLCLCVRYIVFCCVLVLFWIQIYIHDFTVCPMFMATTTIKHIPYVPFMQYTQTKPIRPPNKYLQIFQQHTDTYSKTTKTSPFKKTIPKSVFSLLLF